MKKYLLISVIFAIAHLSVCSQQVINNTGSIIDKAPNTTFSQKSPTVEIRDIWDLQFEFPIADTTQGIETDGEYIYITNWRNSSFKKYDLQGNFIEYFTIPGVSEIEDLAYDGQYFYGGKATNSLFIMDFVTKTLIEEVQLTFPIRGIAYNPQEDVFYGNNWNQSYIYEFNIQGVVLDSIQATEYGWTYGYAYDGWSEGGPYLWGFSQYNNQTEAILTQYSIKDKEPTGFYKDLAYLASDPTYVFAGGLFTHQNLVTGTVTIGGLIQNDIVFGFELDSILCEAPINFEAYANGFSAHLSWIPPANQDFFIIGYNIYRNDTLINNITNTTYIDSNLPYGVHTYQVTTLYQDDLGNPGCESNPTQSIEVNIEPPATTLGGNVIAGPDKMYFGYVNAYLYKNQEVEQIYTSNIIDTLGYYFFLPFVNQSYYLHASPKPLSAYAEQYVPTYYGDKIHWEDAPTVLLENSIYDANINMTTLKESESGSGSIQGNISFQSASYQMNPASDNLVMLLNETNECIAYQISDHDGEFSFTNLASGTYKILIEVVGRAMTPSQYTLNDEITSINNISFVITNEEILIGMEETLPQYVNYVSDLFPNPATIKTHFEINLNKSANISTTLFDARSKIISQKSIQLVTGANRVSLVTTSLPSGIYYYQIGFEDGQSIIRKIIIMN